MPKVFIHYPAGAFSEDGLAALAAEITSTGLKYEKLPDTPYVRSNIWVYGIEYPAGTAFHTRASSC
jgi:hypothetical protein